MVLELTFFLFCKYAFDPKDQDLATFSSSKCEHKDELDVSEFAYLCIYRPVDLWQIAKLSELQFSQVRGTDDFLTG